MGYILWGRAKLSLSAVHACFCCLNTEDNLGLKPDRVLDVRANGKNRKKNGDQNADFEGFDHMSRGLPA